MCSTVRADGQCFFEGGWVVHADVEASSGKLHGHAEHGCVVLVASAADGWFAPRQVGALDRQLRGRRHNLGNIGHEILLYWVSGGGVEGDQLLGGLVVKRVCGPVCRPGIHKATLGGERAAAVKRCHKLGVGVRVFECKRGAFFVPVHGHRRGARCAVKDDVTPESLERPEQVFGYGAGLALLHLDLVKAIAPHTASRGRFALDVRVYFQGLQHLRELAFVSSLDGTTKTRAWLGIVGRNKGGQHVGQLPLVDTELGNGFADIAEFHCVPHVAKEGLRGFDILFERVHVALPLDECLVRLLLLS